MSKIETEICRICGKEKPINKFEIDNRRKGKRTNRCKVCKSSLQNRANLAFANSKRRAERAGIQTEVTLNQIKAIYNAHDGRCMYCGVTEDETGKTHHLEHITSLNRGGRNCASNLVICCGTCNRSKGEKPLMSFYLNQDRNHFSEESMAAVAMLISLTSGQPFTEVVVGLLEEHATYVIEQNTKQLEKVLEEMTSDG